MSGEDRGGEKINASTHDRRGHEKAGAKTGGACGSRGIWGKKQQDNQGGLCDFETDMTTIAT